MRGIASPPLAVPESWMPQRIDVEVWGGLGNRLFMMAAGFTLARRCQRPLRLLTHQATNLPGLVGGLDVQGLFAALPDPPEVATLPEPRSRRFTRGREKLRQLIDQVGLSREEPLEGGRLLRVLDEGVESVRIQGYFQSLDTVVHAVDLGWPMRAPLTQADRRWVQETLEAAAGDLPFGVHVRRGDYLQPVNQRRLGSPSARYYRAALDRLGADAQGEACLFSDEPSAARAFLGEAGVLVTRSFGPLDSPSEGAALDLMSATSGLVVSNSTFAWWGAFWGAHPQGVAYPQPWHDRVHAESLPSPGWVPVPKNPPHLDGRAARGRLEGAS